MDIKKYKSLFRLFIVAIILFSNGASYFPVFAKEDIQRNPREITNDNPDVTFTATGIATEPSPLHIISYSPATLRTWANTSLDSPAVPNGWGVNTDGSLVSPRRKPTDTQLSFPSSNNTTLLSKINNGNLPSCSDRGWPPGACASWNQVNSMRYNYIGNNKFIAVGTKDYGNVSYGNYIYLMGTDMVGKPFYLFPDYQIPFGGGFSYYSTMTWYMNEFTDEFMVVGIIPESHSYGGGSGGDYYSTNTERFQVYSLSDLRNGTIAMKRSGTFYEQYHARLSSSDITRTGVRANWSDGSYVLSAKDYLPFDKDYKKIDLTTRTISSYRYKEATPYKVESYTSMPAMSKIRSLYYCDGVKYSQFCSETGVDQYFSGVANNNGDYFTMGTENV
jgi:hypothetical protein